jgi:hypothetical protein
MFSMIIFAQTSFASYHRIILHHNIMHHFSSFIKGEEGKLLLHPIMRLIYEAKYMFAEKLWNKAGQRRRCHTFNGCPHIRQRGQCFYFGNGILQDLRQKRDFFMKREKKGRCFFAFGSKMVRMIISHYTKKYITR